MALSRPPGRSAIPPLRTRLSGYPSHIAVDAPSGSRPPTPTRSRTTRRAASERSDSCRRPSSRTTRCASCSQEYRRVVSEPLRIVIGEDDVLLREGVARLLDDAGMDVVARAGDADDFLRKTLAHRPDVAVVDVQMPPRHE